MIYILAIISMSELSVMINLYSQTQMSLSFTLTMVFVLSLRITFPVLRFVLSKQEISSVMEKLADKLPRSFYSKRKAGIIVIGNIGQ